MVLLNVRYKPSKSRAKALGRQSVPKSRRPTDKVCFGYEALSLSSEISTTRTNESYRSAISLKKPLYLCVPGVSAAQKQSKVAWASRGFSSSVVSATVVNDK